MPPSVYERTMRCSWRDFRGEDQGARGDSLVLQRQPQLTPYLGEWGSVH